jgi:hypothetical protein
MWLITPQGLYSAVAKPEDDEEFVTVRARSGSDIRNLAALIDAEPSRDDGTDYRSRAPLPGIRLGQGRQCNGRRDRRRQLHKRSSATIPPEPTS